MSQGNIFFGIAAVRVPPEQIPTHPMLQQHAQAMHCLNQRQNQRKRIIFVQLTAMRTGRKSASHASTFSKRMVAARGAGRASFVTFTGEALDCDLAKRSALSPNV